MHTGGTFFCCLFAFFIFISITKAQIPPCCVGGDFPISNCDCSSFDITYTAPTNDCSVEIIANSIIVSSGNSLVFSGCSLIATQDITIALDDADVSFFDSSLDAGGDITITAGYTGLGATGITMSSTSISNYTTLNLEGYSSVNAVVMNSVTFNPAPISSAYIYAESSIVSDDIIVIDSISGTMNFANFTFDVFGNGDPLSGVHFLGEHIFTGNTNFTVNIIGASSSRTCVIFDPLLITFTQADVSFDVNGPIGIQISSQFIIEQSIFDIQCESDPLCIKVEAWVKYHHRFYY